MWLWTVSQRGSLGWNKRDERGCDGKERHQRHKNSLMETLKWGDRGCIQMTATMNIVIQLYKELACEIVRGKGNLVPIKRNLEIHHKECLCCSERK